MSKRIAAKKQDRIADERWGENEGENKKKREIGEDKTERERERTIQLRL